MGARLPGSLGPPTYQACRQEGYMRQIFCSVGAQTPRNPRLVGESREGM